jgi:hypothetical protein
MGSLDIAGASALVGLRRSEAGSMFRKGATSIPDGHGRGILVLGTGGQLARAAAFLTYALVWRGKVVDARAGRLKNLISPLGVPAIAAQVYEDSSWYDGDRCVVLDYSKTSWVARRVRDEIREVAPSVFLGLVFVGRRLVLHFALDFTGRDRSR